MSIHVVDNADLPPDWNEFLHPLSAQTIGDKFVSEKKYCVMQIPSAVTWGDHNFLINANHPDFKQIAIIETAKFPFDKRIFK